MGKGRGKIDGATPKPSSFGKKDLKQKVRDAYGKLEDKFLQNKEERQVKKLNRIYSREGLPLTEKGNPNVRVKGGLFSDRIVTRYKLDDNLKRKQVEKRAKKKDVISAGGLINKDKSKTIVKYKRNGDTVVKEKKVTGPLFRKNREVTVTRRDAEGNVKSKI